MLRTKTPLDTDPMFLLLDAMLDGPNNQGGHIERQEARGQDHLANAREGNTILLPLDGSGIPDPNRKYGSMHTPKGGVPVWEAVGVTFGDMADNDPLFVKASVPDGWRIVKTDHAMWSYLADEQGRERASIFYKAAFYDRSAHMSIRKCLNTGTQRHPEDAKKDYSHQRERFTVEVAGPGQKPLCLLWVGNWSHPYDKNERDNEKSGFNRYMRERDEESERAKAWLSENYPYHENPAFYWDRTDWPALVEGNEATL